VGGSGWDCKIREITMFSQWLCDSGGDVGREGGSIARGDDMYIYMYIYVHMYMHIYVCVYINVCVACEAHGRERALCV